MAVRLLVEVALACLSGAGCIYATTWWQIGRAGRCLPKHAGQIIVVFGARATEGRPSPELEARLRFAASLYRAALAPRVLCSGGHPGAQSEPRVMRRALVALGVPEWDILIDEHGDSTRSTIGAAKAHLRGQAGHALLVSSPYHMHRIGREAQRQGVAAECWPAGKTPQMRHGPSRRRQMRREVLATWWYAMPARLTTARRPSPIGERLTAAPLGRPTGSSSGR